MLYSLLQTVALTTPEESFSFRASTAGIVSLQGMLTIFLVLAIIWGAIEIMHRLLSKNDDPKPKREPKPAKPKKAEKSADTALAPNADDAAIAAAIAAALAASEDEGATVAAITAAISAALAEDGYTGNFRVVSFKRAATNRRR